MADATTANPVAGVPTSTNPTGAALTGVWDIINALTGKQPAGTAAAAAAADPFASQRPQYQGMLSNLLTNPGSFTADPGYEFAKEQGLEATSRANNALGIGNSGKNVLDLDKYATGYAEQGYDNRITQLLTASGANSGSPGTAGQILGNASQGSVAGGAGAIGTVLDSILGNGTAGSGLQAMLKLFQGGSGGAGMTGSNYGFDTTSMGPPTGLGLTENYGGDTTSIGPPLPDIFGGIDFSNLAGAFGE